VNEERAAGLKTCSTCICSPLSLLALVILVLQTACSGGRIGDGVGTSGGAGDTAPPGTTPPGTTPPGTTPPGTTPPGTSPPGTTPASLCAGGSPLPLAVSTPLKRLSRFQYMSTLADVVKSWAPSVASQVLAAPAVITAQNTLGEDSRVTGTGDKRGGFRRLDQGVQQDQIDAQFAIAQAVAAELTSSPGRVSALLGPCASDADTTNDAACVQAFVKRAGRLAHRRSLDADDVTFYQTVYGAQGINAAGLTDVLTVMLTSPYFTYQIEHGGDVVDAGQKLYALDGQELVNRLTLQFWGTGPDNTLLAMVDSGSILTDEGYSLALEHIKASPLMANAVSEFFREYLSLEDLDEMNHLNGTARFDALRGAFSPTDQTRENMIDEVLRLATYYAAKPDGKFSDLFTTRKSFATTTDVAQIYGVAPWSGTGEPPDLVDPDRVGLITRAAMVASGAVLTRPIMKGVVLRNVLMCDSIGQPPANAMMVAQEAQATVDPLSSTRTMTKALTESRSDCSACHLGFINPLGFSTEMFDPLGRKRQMESIFDDAGKLLGQVPIDTTATPRLTAGDTTTSSNPGDLQARMLVSNKLQVCMARKYFRFTFGKLEEATDNCTIQAISDGLTQGKPLGQVLIDLAKTPAFKQRRFN
jgi:Protein of unknown function (DUF1588)/Protein of unknown function (DUF1592)/Protein of unknown function (DUF1595)/Protein of unknown function (DUF1585)